MKNLITSTFLVLAGFVSQATGNNGNEAILTVRVTNLGDRQGKLMVGIFDSQENFLAEPLFGKEAKVTAEGQEVVFEGVPLGEYAVSIIQDENENGKLDTFLVIPTEPYGFSNNAMGRMGPPSFEQAKFTLDKNLTIEIKLNR